MDISKFLSKVIGIYFILVSSAMLLNMQHFMQSVTDLINNTSLMFALSFITLILGILLVVSHNIWQWNWRLIITVTCWLTLLKGISLLFYPQYIVQMSESFVQNVNVAYGEACFLLMLGLLFCFFGFKR